MAWSPSQGQSWEARAELPVSCVAGAACFDADSEHVFLLAPQNGQNSRVLMGRERASSWLQIRELDYKVSMLGLVEVSWRLKVYDVRDRLAHSFPVLATKVHCFLVLISPLSPPDLPFLY